MWTNVNAHNQIRLSHEAFEAIPDKGRVLKWIHDQRRRDERATEHKIEEGKYTEKERKQLREEVNKRFQQDMYQWFWRHFYEYIRKAKETNPELYETRWS